MQNQYPNKMYVLVPDQPAQIQNDSALAAATLSSIIKTCLGPRAMQKMVLTKINSIEITNDGNSILRELDVAHPSARSLIELARTQDDEIGDGTTSVIIIASEILAEMTKILNQGVHPIKVCKSLNRALDICIEALTRSAIQLENNEEARMKIIRSSVATKICTVLKVPVPELAYKTVKLIFRENKVDFKNCMKIEKIIGSDMADSEIIDGVILNKDIIHPQMRRFIENPRVIILDSPLEYKKGESQTNFEFSKQGDFTRALEIEEEQVRGMCDKILELKPDVVVTEKGFSDLALSIMHSHNITGLRRLKKTDTQRLSKVTGAIIANRCEDLEEKHVGKMCGLFEYLKYGDDYYCKFSKCENPRACSVILRGPTKDIMNELERNFMDAVKVAKNIFLSPRLLPGGGAAEVSMSLSLLSSEGTDLDKQVFSGISNALNAIPTILLGNCGACEPLKALAKLEKRHRTNEFYYGINGMTGEVVDMRSIVLEPMAVKTQCITSAIEAVSQLLRIDGIIESRRQ